MVILEGGREGKGKHQDWKGGPVGWHNDGGLQIHAKELPLMCFNRLCYLLSFSRINFWRLKHRLFILAITMEGLASYKAAAVVHVKAKKAGTKVLTSGVSVGHGEQIQDTTDLIMS